MRRAFREVLSLSESELIIPQRFASMGAIGAVLLVLEDSSRSMQFRGLETLKAYLFTIARNIYLKKLRKGKDYFPLKDTFPDRNPQPEELIDSRLELQRVRSVLQDLSEIDRAAFILRIQHELSYAEIARVLEISLSATKVKVHRVRKKLLATRVDKEVY